jgi:cold shock protein
MPLLPEADPGNRTRHNLLKESIMAQGVVKWFNPTKGFGFIQPNDGGADVFVHISAVERAGLRTLNEGQQISYELERDRKSGKMSAGQLSAA